MPFNSLLSFDINITESIKSNLQFQNHLSNIFISAPSKKVQAIRWKTGDEKSVIIFRSATLYGIGRIVYVSEGFQHWFVFTWRSGFEPNSPRVADAGTSSLDDRLTESFWLIRKFLKAEIIIFNVVKK